MRSEEQKFPQIESGREIFVVCISYIADDCNCCTLLAIGYRCRQHVDEFRRRKSNIVNSNE